MARSVAGHFEKTAGRELVGGRRTSGRGFRAIGGDMLSGAWLLSIELAPYLSAIAGRQQVRNLPVVRLPDGEMP
jgi:hypothetical protein